MKRIIIKSVVLISPQPCLDKKTSGNFEPTRIALQNVIIVFSDLVWPNTGLDFANVLLAQEEHGHP